MHTRFLDSIKCNDSEQRLVAYSIEYVLKISDLESTGDLHWSKQWSNTSSRSICSGQNNMNYNISLFILTVGGSSQNWNNSV
jgi:hypothetical protein